MEHPSPDLLLRFLLGTTSRPENRQVVRHLLARCPTCAATLRQLRREPPLSPPPSPEGYDPAFDRAAVFVRELLQKSPPAAVDDRLPGSGASGNAARRRWLFG
jgi:anti-sigma factor RsiW